MCKNVGKNKESNEKIRYLIHKMNLVKKNSVYNFF